MVWVLPITVLRSQMSRKRKSAGQVLPITVLRSQMNKKRKSVGQVLPITVLRSQMSKKRTSLAYYRFAVISNTDIGFRSFLI